MISVQEEREEMIEIVMEVDDEFWNIINQLKEFKEKKEIIPCKDCKHWFYFIESEKHHPNCGAKMVR